MAGRTKFLLILGALFVLLIFNSRFFVLGHDFKIIAAGNVEGIDGDIYVIYSPNLTSESARINTIRKAAYRIYRRYFKSPVTIYLSPYKKNYGVFLAKVKASCAGGLCFSYGLASTGVDIGSKEQKYISRYHELAKSRQSFDEKGILPRLYKEMGRSEVDRIHSKLGDELIFGPFFLTNEFHEREIESIF